MAGVAQSSFSVVVGGKSLKKLFSREISSPSSQTAGFLPCSAIYALAYYLHLL